MVVVPQPALRAHGSRPSDTHDSTHVCTQTQMGDTAALNEGHRWQSGDGERRTERSHAGWQDSQNVRTCSSTATAMMMAATQSNQNSALPRKYCWPMRNALSSACGARGGLRACRRVGRARTHLHVGRDQADVHSMVRGDHKHAHQRDVLHSGERPALRARTQARSRSQCSRMVGWAGWRAGGRAGGRRRTVIHFTMNV
jgi:hypothetical protein